MNVRRDMGDGAAVRDVFDFIGAPWIDRKNVEYPCQQSFNARNSSRFYREHCSVKDI
jgi:hypothetical protein